jgi:hypothetical protein
MTAATRPRRTSGSDAVLIRDFILVSSTGRPPHPDMDEAEIRQRCARVSANPRAVIRSGDYFHC